MPGGTGGPVAGVSDALPATEFEALRAHLLEHSVRRGDFTLKSGRKSSWFIDSKQTVCRPEAMVLVADGVLSVIPADADAIGGLTMGADPVAFVTAGVAATRGGGSRRSASARRPRTTAGVAASPVPSIPGTGWWSPRTP